MAVKMYYRNDGSHESWESLYGDVILMKDNYGSGWTAHRKWGVFINLERQEHRIIGGDLDYVVKALKEQHGITVIFDKSKQWVKAADPKAGMILKKVS